MLVREPAIVCAVRAHGEHGAIVRVLTERHGLIPGYVRGARSRTQRPVLIPGNSVAIELRARDDARLPAMTVEPLVSRAALLTQPLAAAAIDWITALVAATLPEGQPYPPIHHALGAVLDAIDAAPSARGWAPAIARFEVLLLDVLGFGDGGQGDWAALPDAVTAARLREHLLAGKRGDVLAARDRLMNRLTRAIG